MNTIPYNLAVQLNAAGLGKPSIKYYNIYNKCVFECDSSLHKEAVWAPTYFEVVMWFETKHNIQVTPDDKSILDGLTRLNQHEQRST